MKLKLTEMRGIQILSVSGGIDDAAFAVLKAGITKIMRSGKNRIVLELAEVSALSDTTAMELATFNKLAKELAGEVVIAAANEALRSQFLGLQFKPTVTAKASVEEALQVFGSPGESPAAGSAEVTALRQELQALKQKLLDGEKGGEIGKLRREHAEFQKANVLLREQIEQMLIARRTPADEPGFLEKIRGLESQLEEAFGKVEQLEAAKAKGP